jgi:hypothetical protein
MGMQFLCQKLVHDNDCRAGGLSSILNAFPYIVLALNSAIRPKRGRKAITPSWCNLR